jgi:hypothetical protein
MGDDPPAHRVHAVGMPIEEELERAPVTVDGAGDEDAVVLVTQPSPR